VAVADAKAGEPLAPVTVVVPSNHVGVASRRLLASGALGPVCGAGPGLVAVTFLTVYRLAELLGAAGLATQGRRPVSTPVIAAALRAALAEDPGVFGPVATHPATETALVAAYRELRDVSTDALDRLATAGERAADVVRLHRAARARLARSFYDEEDLLDAATAAVGAGGAAPLGRLVVHLPQRLSRHAVTLLRAFAAAADVTVVAAATGAGRADAEVAESVERLGAGPAPQGGGEDGATARIVADGRTRFVTASDADEEVRAGVRAVVDAARRGTRLDRIAILYASPEPYARLAWEQLSAAGIPANGSAVMPLAARLTGRALLGLLRLPDGGFRRQDVFAWLQGAPFLDGDRPAPVGAWERLSRDAAVVGGRADWDQRLEHFAAGQVDRAVVLEGDPDEAGWRVAAARADAERARSLRRFVLALIDDLSSAAAGPRPWAAHVRWARGLLERHLGAPARRGGWPASEVRAAERVEVALERLAALDRVEGPVELDVFARTVALELDADLGRTGRLGEGVLVGSVGMGLGLDLDVVIILGLAEGLFPSLVRDDSLLPDHERAATAGQLRLRAGGIDRQHRELLAALAGAREHVLGIPRGDLRRSSQRVPSRWALDIASALGDGRVRSDGLLGTAAPWVDHLQSFDDALRRLAFPATAQEYRLRSLLAGVTDRSTEDAVLAAGAAMVAARRGPRFTRFDGNLAGLAIPSPAETITSATRLERWAACPFAYLMQDVLGVQVVTDPEAELRITALVKGELVHLALERFVGEGLASPPDPGRGWSPDDRARITAIGDALCDEYERRGLTGKAVFWWRDRIRLMDDLRHFLDEDDAYRSEFRVRPVAAELAFGLPGADVDAVAMSLPDGRAVRFRGKADRVDEAEDGSLRVIDYKTGKREPYTSLTEDNPDGGGQLLQLPVYGAAARAMHDRPDAPVQADYWFISAGKRTRIGFPVSAAVLDRFGQTLQAIVSGIEHGAFPNHPVTTSSSPRWDCPYCDPDRLGVTELRARWDRKRADPALARYADRVEPEGALDGV